MTTITVPVRKRVEKGPKGEVRYFGLAGLGKRTKGKIKKIAGEDEPVLPQLLNGEMEDAILFGGAYVVPEAVEKAQALGAAGIIVGGMPYRDFARRRTSDEAFPIIVTEGFGIAPVQIILPEEEAEIDGENAWITFASIKAPREETAEKVPLEAGLTVRLLAFPHLGKTGKIVKVSSSQEKMASGLRDLIAEVQTKSGEKVLTAVSNLEAIFSKM